MQSVPHPSLHCVITHNTLLCSVQPHRALLQQKKTHSISFNFSSGMHWLRIETIGNRLAKCIFTFRKIRVSLESTTKSGPCSVKKKKEPEAF